MTISSATRKAGPYTGNSVATAFPFAFKLFTTADLTVTLSDGTTETTLVLGSAYTVSMNGDQDGNPGGFITYPLSGSPLDSSHTLTLTGGIAETQPTSIQNQGGFYPKVIEHALDRGVILVQQLAELVSRAIHFPVSENTNTELPTVANRANSLFGFDANGVPTTYIPSAQTAAGVYTTLASAPGSSYVGFQQAGTQPKARTAQSKMRDIVAAVDFIGVDITGATDSTTGLVNCAALGMSIFMTGAIKFSTIDLSAVGQRVYGAGMGGQSDILAVAGGSGIRLRARNTGVSNVRFLPVTNVTNVQSAVAYDCITIKEASSDDNYVEAVMIDRVHFENLVGAAIKIVSPLRESTITKCRFIGMGDVPNGIGPIDCSNPSNTNRSPNNLYISDSTFYRFGTPAINFKVNNTGSVVGRTEPFYEGIHIERNLIHGQLLDITAMPLGFSVYPELTHSVFIESGQNIHIHKNTITATHPDRWSIWCVSFINAGLLSSGINFNYFISENSLAYHEISVPSYTGGNIRVKDCISCMVHNNTMLTGGGNFTYNIKLDNGGAHSSTLVANVSGNRSSDQYALKYRVDDISTLAAEKDLILTGTSPRVTSYDRTTGEYGYFQQDGSGVLTIACNEGAIAGPCYTQFKVRGLASIRVGEFADISAVKYISMVAVTDGSAPISTLYNSSTNGKLSWKDAAGVVNALY